MGRPKLKRVLGATVAGLAKDMRRFTKRQRLYSSWRDAAARATYESDVLTEYRARKAERLIETGRFREIDTPGLNLLKLCALQLRATGRTVSVVDFGGSFGDEGLALVGDPLFGQDVDYAVCESPAVRQRAAKIAYPPQIRFIGDLGEVTACDIFYSSCTLPYVENVGDILRTAVRFRPYFILLVRNCFAERELIRVQKSMLFHNGPQNVAIDAFANQPVLCPHHTQDLSETVATLGGSDYVLIGSFPEESGVYPYGDETFGRDLLFVDGKRLNAPGGGASAG